jgi:hypothetical protein
MPDYPVSLVEFREKEVLRKSVLLFILAATLLKTFLCSRFLGRRTALGIG